MHKEISNLNNEIIENQGELDAITVENTQKGSHVNNLKKMIGLKKKSTVANLFSSAKNLTEA